MPCGHMLEERGCIGSGGQGGVGDIAVRGSDQFFMSLVMFRIMLAVTNWASISSFSLVVSSPF